MTAEQVAALGPAFSDYLRCFRSCFVTHNTFGHLGTYCRGLLSDLARKSVEPIALAAGCTVRTLQEFLTHHAWDQERMRDEIQRRVAHEHLPAPGNKPQGGVGVVGWIDERGQERGTRPRACSGSIAGRRARSTTASSPSTWPAAAGSSL